MGSNRVLVVGGGLAGLAATMKLAELGVQVDLLSLTPVKRSHSVCAQGGINSVSDMTRQDGDDEWKHFDDTVYGGDFLQHHALAFFQNGQKTLPWFVWGLAGNRAQNCGAHSDTSSQQENDNWTQHGRFPFKWVSLLRWNTQHQVAANQTSTARERDRCSRPFPES